MNINRFRLVPVRALSPLINVYFFAIFFYMFISNDSFRLL